MEKYDIKLLASFNEMVKTTFKIIELLNTLEEYDSIDLGYITTKFRHTMNSTVPIIAAEEEKLKDIIYKKSQASNDNHKAMSKYVSDIIILSQEMRLKVTDLYNKQMGGLNVNTTITYRSIYSTGTANSNQRIYIYGQETPEIPRLHSAEHKPPTLSD